MFMYCSLCTDVGSVWYGHIAPPLMSADLEVLFAYNFTYLTHFFNAVHKIISFAYVCMQSQS